MKSKIKEREKIVSVKIKSFINTINEVLSMTKNNRKDGLILVSKFLFPINIVLKNA